MAVRGDSGKLLRWSVKVLRSVVEEGQLGLLLCGRGADPHIGVKELGKPLINWQACLGYPPKLSVRYRSDTTTQDNIPHCLNIVHLLCLFPQLDPTLGLGILYLFAAVH